MAIITMEEHFSWEIKYDEVGKPFYYNRFSERSLQCRPTCLENGGRVSIREPVIEAQYKGLWYKGVLLGPADNIRFSVQLEQAPVQLLNVDRNKIRKWSIKRRHTVPSSPQRRGSELSSHLETYDAKEPFGDNESLSKLSVSYTLISDEKFDYDLSQSRRHGKASDSLTSDSRVRSKSWGCAAKREMSYTGCSWSEEEFGEDVGKLDMVPLKTDHKGDGFRRNRRLNAVLIDLDDLSTIKRTVKRN